jgi:hypothetical protein
MYGTCILFWEEFFSSKMSVQKDKNCQSSITEGKISTRGKLI